MWIGTQVMAILSAVSLSTEALCAWGSLENLVSKLAQKGIPKMF